MINYPLLSSISGDLYISIPFTNISSPRGTVSLALCRNSHSPGKQWWGPRWPYRHPPGHCPRCSSTACATRRYEVRRRCCRRWWRCWWRWWRSTPDLRQPSPLRLSPRWRPCNGNVSPCWSGVVTSSWEPGTHWSIEQSSRECFAEHGLL